jgi:hypothetical protein
VAAVRRDEDYEERDTGHVTDPSRPVIDVAGELPGGEQCAQLGLDHQPWKRRLTAAAMASSTS